MNVAILFIMIMVLRYHLRGKYLACRDFTNKYHEFSPSTKGKNVAVIGETVPVLFSSKTNSYYRISNDIIHAPKLEALMSVK